MDASVPIFEHLLGPLGWDVPPAGEHSFEEIVADYRARLGEGGGAVHINCMFTMAESRAALLAAAEAAMRTANLPAVYICWPPCLWRRAWVLPLLV